MVLQGVINEMLLLSTNLRRKRFSSVDFLINELAANAEQYKARDFHQFQVDLLREFLPHFLFFGSWVTLKEIDLDTGITIDISKNYLIETEQNLVGLYLENQGIDPIRKCRTKIYGTAINESMYMNYDLFEESDFFRKYKKVAGIGETFLISYPVPFQPRFCISFGFESGEQQRFCNSVSKDELEYYLAPIYFSWLNIFGFIDLSVLHAWLHQYSQISPMQLLVIRELNNARMHRLDLSADRLGVSKRTFEKHISNINIATKYSSKDQPCLMRKKSQIVDIIKNCSFGKFLGRPATHADVINTMSCIELI